MKKLHSIKNEKKVYHLDLLDKEILTYLQERNHAKSSLRKIAKSLDISVSTVKKHLDRLKMAKIIKQYMIEIDYEKIGYDEQCFFFIHIGAKPSIASIFEKLEKKPPIYSIYQISGDQPIVCIARCIDKTKQLELIEYIKSIDGVESVETQIVLNTIKNEKHSPIP